MRSRTAPGSAEWVGGSPEDRLASLYDRHHRRLWNLARRMSRDTEDALDLVQEVFLRAARRPGDLPPDAPGAEAWLVRVLVNLCLDRWRQRRRRRELAPPAAWDAVAGAASGDASIERTLIARSVVAAALDTLPPRQRAVIVLHELEDRDTMEIARLLGVTRVTVRWHLAAARAALVRRLAPQPGSFRPREGSAR